MASDKIRVGVIGATWGERAHVPAVKALPEMELAAVCTAHDDTAKAMAERTGAPRAYGDATKLVADPDIDLVTIAARPAYHYPLTKLALEAGKDVLCEWPSGLNVQQVDELLALSKQKGRITAVGLQARWSPVVMHLQKLMEEGYVGDVLSFGVNQFMSQYNRPTPSARWWTTKKEEGGTALTLAASAVLDILNLSAGLPVELAASAEARMNKMTWSDTGETVDVTSPDTVAVAARLANGAIGTITASRVAWQGSGQRVEIYGTGGSLQLVLVYKEEIKGRRQVVMGGRAGESLKELPIPEEYNFTPEVPADAGFFAVAQMMRRVGEAVRTRKPIEPDYRTSAQIHRVLAAIERASDEKRWVPVEQAPA